MDRNDPVHSPDRRLSHVDSLEDLALPAAMMTANGLLMEANEAYCEAFGLDHDKVLGTSVYDRVDAQMAERIRCGFAQLSPGRPTLNSPAMLQTLHGRQRRRIWKTTGLFDDEKRLQAVLLVFWDVTEEYRYNETLEELIRVTNDRSLNTEEVVEGILAIGHAYFEMTAGIISRHTEDGIYPEFQIRNDYAEMGGLVPHDFTYTSITHAKGSIVAIQDIDKTQYADAPFRKRLNLRSFLSAEIYVEGTLYGALSFAAPEPRAQPFTNEEIQLIRILVQWLSYALARRRKVSELKASEEKYRFIYQNSPIMMHTVNADLTISDVNKMWLERLGYEYQNVIGTSLYDYFTETSREAVRAAAERRVELPLVDAPRTMLRVDGSLVEVEASTLSDPDSGPLSVLTVLNDVTDRNRAQRSLARLNEGLRRTNDGLKRFNAIAAHDLQEPLRKIKLFGDMLDEALCGSDNPQVREPLTVIRRSADRLTKLVSDLQTYTRETQRGVHRMPVDLDRLVAEVLDGLEPDADTRIEIGALPQVTGDPKSLGKLFANLLMTALASPCPAPPHRIRVLSKSSENGSARVIIRDNGDVRPETTAGKLLGPFARAHAPAGAEDSDTGIRLAIAKSIVEGHGWEIRAEPAPDGAGTDFIIDIPAHQIIRRFLPDHP